MMAGALPAAALLSLMGVPAGRAALRSASMRISCGSPTMKPSAAMSASASRTVASKVEWVISTTVRVLTSLRRAS